MSTKENQNPFKSFMHHDLYPYTVHTLFQISKYNLHTSLLTRELKCSYGEQEICW